MSGSSNSYPSFDGHEAINGSGAKDKIKVSQAKSNVQAGDNFSQRRVVNVVYASSGGTYDESSVSPRLRNDQKTLTPTATPEDRSSSLLKRSAIHLNF